MNGEKTPKWGQRGRRRDIQQTGCRSATFGSQRGVHTTYALAHLAAYSSRPYVAYLRYDDQQKAEYSTLACTPSYSSAMHYAMYVDMRLCSKHEMHTILFVYTNITRHT